MALRKVTLFDKEGTTLEPVDEEGQAKPCVLGIRWVNTDTFETIRVRGGKRTGPKGELLKEINRTKTVIVVEHDMTFVRDLGVRVTCLHEGSVLAEGTIDQVSADERVVEVYLGR